MSSTFNSESTANNLRWYAVHTNPKEEDRATNNLMAWKVEAFNPKIKKARTNPFTDAVIYESRPLFPRYIFARFDAHALLSKVWFTRGVKSVVSFGSGPVPVDDEIIAFIKEGIRDDALIKHEMSVKTGDEVVIKDGLLSGLTGIFKSGIKGTDRVIILLNAISYQGSIVIEKEHIKKVG